MKGGKSKLVTLFILSNTLLSIGTPGAPGGAIASFAALASIAGLPTGIMGVYISVNTLCDMGAACCNVLGGLACSAEIFHQRQQRRALIGCCS